MHEPSEWSQLRLIPAVVWAAEVLAASENSPAKKSDSIPKIFSKSPTFPLTPVSKSCTIQMLNERKKMSDNDFWPTDEEIGEMWFDDVKGSTEKEDEYIPPHS